MFLITTIITIFSFGVTTRCHTNNSNKLDDYFGACTKTDLNFDSCVKELLNSLRPLFKSGLAEYGITSFDPFFIQQVVQKRKWANFDYELILRDVYESGWTKSIVTDFKSSLFDQNSIEYIQFFPDKNLKGVYEIKGHAFGHKINNNGTWNLNLLNYTQTTVITRKPRQAHNGTLIYDTPIEVSVMVGTCQKLTLHIINLLKGLTIFEKFVDIIINNFWQSGFKVLRPFIDDIVSTAFTQIFNNAFKNFNFNQIIV